MAHRRHPFFFFFFLLFSFLLLLLEPFEVVSVWVGGFPAFFIRIGVGVIFLIPLKDSVILKKEKG